MCATAALCLLLAPRRQIEAIVRRTPTARPGKKPANMAGVGNWAQVSEEGVSLGEVAGFGVSSERAVVDVLVSEEVGVAEDVCDLVGEDEEDDGCSRSTGATF